MVRRYFFGISLGVVLALILWSLVWPPVLWAFLVVAPVIATGLHDVLQTKAYDPAQLSGDRARPLLA